MENMSYLDSLRSLDSSPNQGQIKIKDVGGKDVNTSIVLTHMNVQLYTTKHKDKSLS